MTPPSAPLGSFRAARLVSAERFREVIASAPRVDEKFADDLRAVRRRAFAQRLDAQA